jgi:hypothetical protein
MRRHFRRSTSALSVVLALVGAFAVGYGHHDAAAQDATPTSMVGHPLVGTWIVDPEPENPANTPSLVVYTADGIVIDPVAGFAGSWRATGPRTAVFTLSGISEETGSYLVIRGPVEVEEATDATNGPYTVTIVGADGTVLATDQGTGHATRLPAESGEAGTPLARFPTWTPATPEAATPAP